MDKGLKTLQQQFDNDVQLLSILQGSLKERMQEELDNLKFEIDALRHSTQLQNQNAGFSQIVNNRRVLV